ncbi:L-seryl-tRNA(Sec) selenium transferase [Leucobacter sp. cx-328]|uniref:L-seryl-tRNA(Sec) selenium transferase n=1 Tax=unclassified Leucobacter TaxID=2621730 RepID=UPI00165DC9C1|nr:MULTISPECIES: L-seryl-tRNA(Sec) selenium transferase [unclassified Leucobacter]MBC9943546.1 L-seryl-tRNA(Sec) selenium transferase [Leucobacter sp. cx-328]
MSTTTNTESSTGARAGASTSTATGTDPRRRIPRTDQLLALPAVEDARTWLGEQAIRAIITDAQARARAGEITPDAVSNTVVEALAAASPATLTPVINATGVIIHTNLGRAPLSEGAIRAVTRAAGYADIEMDLGTGQRSGRGLGAKAALLEACPAAEDALVVNNGAAALLLAVTALGVGADPRTPGTVGDIVVSRGELVEIGAGFRLPDLMETTGARLREVGATNRTHPADYERALGAGVGCVLKVHPSNFRVEGFTSGVEVAELRALLDAHAAVGGADGGANGARIPLIVDLGSGLIHPESVIPDEPDITAALQAGADIVIASGDKLLGGPQAGILYGTKAAIGQLAKHPLARAVRVDKLALAALEATLRGPETPVQAALHVKRSELRTRVEALATAVAEAIGRTFEVVPHDGRVGGGGAPGVPLPGWALALPEHCASPLRAGATAVVPRTAQGNCLIDLRCVPPHQDTDLAAAIIAVLRAVETEPAA